MPSSAAVPGGMRRGSLCGRKVVPPQRRGIGAITPGRIRPCNLQAFICGIEHWDTITTKQIVLDRYWWPTAHADIHEYVRGCDGCQRASPLPKYRTTLQFPLTNLFDTFPVNLAGPPQIWLWLEACGSGSEASHKLDSGTSNFNLFCERCDQVREIGDPLLVSASGYRYLVHRHLLYSEGDSQIHERQLNRLEKGPSVRACV